MSGLRIHVLVDALGAEVLPQAWLEAYLPHRRALRTVLGYSSGAVPMILTGRPPAVTGHWNLFYLDPEASPFAWLRHLDFLPEAWLNNRYSRRLLTEIGRRGLGLGPLFECSLPPRQLSWFNYVEKRDIFEPGGIAGAPSIFDHLAATGEPYRCYTYRQGSDRELVARAAADVRSGCAGWYFLYLSELDGFLHFHRGDAAAVTARLAWYEEQLSGLFALAQARDPEAAFTLFSDHGMAPVRASVDVAGVVERLGLRPEKDYLAVYDSTMARFWFFQPAARERVEAALEDCAGGRWLSDAELSAAGTLFPDRRFGERIFLLDPGRMMARGHFNGGGWNPSGMHGYHPDDPDSDAVFCTNQPLSPTMRDIGDIFPCLRAGLEAVAA